MDKIQVYVEALIFSSAQSLRLEEITFALQAHFNQDFEPQQIQDIVQVLQRKFEDENSAIQLVKLNNGYQFLTKEPYYQIIIQLQNQKSNKKLSQSAIETLAIIAYQQPVTKLEIEQIRGVNCDYAVQRLLEKELIQLAGKAETVGKPLLYKTSEIFMDYFGINTMADLPQLKDLEKNENAIGEIEA